MRGGVGGVGAGAGAGVGVGAGVGAGGVGVGVGDPSNNWLGSSVGERLAWMKLSRVRFLVWPIPTGGAGRIRAYQIQKAAEVEWHR